MNRRHGINDNRISLSRIRLRHLAPVALSVLVLLACVGCPSDTTPPGSVTNASAQPGNAQVELSWTNPVDGDLAGVKILRKTDSAPTSPTDGTVVFEAAGSAYLNTSLSNGTKYYYALYAYDDSKNYAPAAQLTARPVALQSLAENIESMDDLSSDLQGVALVFSADERAALLAKLDAAVMAYGAGDTCGAAGLLVEFDALAQAYRLGDSMESAEEVFNRGRMLRHNILLGLPSKAACPGTERVGLVADTTVEAEDLTQVMTFASFGEPTVQTVRQGGEVFTQLQVDGADTSGGEPGMPAVAVFRRVVIAPIDSQVTLDVTFEDAETIKLNLFPAQESAVDADDPFGDKPFTKNADIYATNQAFPANPCTLTDLGEVRGVPMLLLEVASGQYNPVTDDLTLYKKVNVSVHFSGGKGFLSEDDVNGFNDGSTLQISSAINRVSAAAILRPGTIFRAYGEELLILTAHDFRPQADTLRAWKNAKGITTSIIEVGPGTDFATADSIRTLIRDEYDRTLIHPSYILLLGDSDRIPTYEMAPGIGVGAATTGSDWPYAVKMPAVPATASVPDFAVGRIPVKTVAEATTVINKIVSYEQSPPNVASFYSSASIASQFQCCRDDVTNPGTDQRGFIETSEFSRNVLLAQGKSVDRIYTETGTGTPRRYFDGTLLPAAIGGGSGFPWSGSTANIISTFNAGRFLYIHRDHGGPDQWVHPFFSAANAAALTNGDLQSVVFSVNCASGLFDNEQVPGVMGTTAGGAYLAEQLLRNPNGGAVGVLGDSRNSPTWANNALTRGFIDAIWPTAIPTYGAATTKRRLGDILNHGKMYMLTQIGLPSGGGAPTSAEGNEELHLWHCIGDPTLEIWRFNPHFRVWPGAFSAALLSGVLTATFDNNDADGAEATITQTDPNGGLVIIGRGMVKGNQLQISKLIQQPIAGVQAQISVAAENAAAKLLTSNIIVQGG